MTSSESLRIQRLLKERVRLAVRRLQLRAFQALTSANPVDTGFSRGNWSPTVGASDAGSLGVHRPSDRTEAQARGAERLRSHTAAASQIAVSYELTGGVVFISNPTVYLPRLNEGYSAQAPAMFVQEAVETAIRVTRAEFDALPKLR